MLFKMFILPGRFSAALSSLGQRPDLIKKIILSEEINPNGVYVLRLCKDGGWKTVLVDDRFPCDSRKRLLFNGVKVIIS